MVFEKGAIAYWELYLESVHMQQTKIIYANDKQSYKKNL